MISNWGGTLKTLIIATVGGCVFQLLHIPLPWLIGPLFSVMMLNISLGYQLKYSKGLKNTGLLFLSFVLGTSFTLETVNQISNHLPLMIIVTMLTVLFSIMMALVISLVGKLKVKDAILGSIPGGLSNMVALGEEIKGTNLTVITTMQLVRLLSVITLVPILAAYLAGGSASGIMSFPEQTVSRPMINKTIDIMVFLITIPFMTWLFHKMKVPTAIIIGPIVCTALLVIIGFKAPQFPPYLLNAAQLLVGAHIGLLMVIKGVGNLKFVLFNATFLSICTIGFSLLMGYLMPNFMEVSILTGLLGAAPGGVAEMGVTAKQLHANIAIVTAYQLFRLFFILLIIPFLLRIILGKLPELQVEKI